MASHRAVAVDECDGDAEGFGQFGGRHAVEKEVALRAERGPGEIEGLPEGLSRESFDEVAAGEQSRDRHLPAAVGRMTVARDGK